MVKIYTALNKEEANFNLIICNFNYIIFDKMTKLIFQRKSENSLKIHFAISEKQIFYSILKYFVAKKNSLCYTIYN